MDKYKEEYSNKDNPFSKKLLIILVVSVIISICIILGHPIFPEYSFDKSEIKLFVGQNADINIQQKESILNTSYSLQTDDKNIIGIYNQKVTALKPGSTTINLVSNGKIHDKCLVTVEHLQPKNIYFKSSAEILLVNEFVKFNIEFVPQNVTDDDVIYVLSDESLARIDGTNLKALKAGKVTITAIHKSTGLTCSKSFTILPTQPTSLKIDAKGEYQMGETFTPSISFSPQNITDKSYKLSSSDTSVLYVNGNMVTANKPGTATLTVTHSSGIQSSLSIKVTPIEATTLNLKVNGKTNLIINTSVSIDYEILPINTTYKAIKWSSSNLSVATVDNNGVVHARSPGKVRITATLNNGVSSYVDFVINTNPVKQENGMVKYPKYGGEAPIAINAPLDEDCYVYFKCLTNSDKDFSIYVSQASSVEVKAPLGEYKLYYATGETWYGVEYRFGIGTDYFTSNEKFVFYQDDNYIYGTELTIRAVSGGNLTIIEIPEDEFPE